MEFNQQSFLIRPFEERDRSFLKNLWERCGLTVHYNDPDHDIDFAVNGPASKIFVGELKKRLIASIMVGHDGHRGWLYYVAVDKDYQKCGCGRAMVSGAENWLKDKGVRKSMLLIRETNEQAKAFYEQIGYEPVPRTVMQKWLT
jgi:ribosomal protein S18 acetylase RimI-like enzyme